MNALKSRRWAIALMASLALNLFLGGVFAASWRAHDDARDTVAPNPMAVLWARESLGEPARATLRRIWAKHGAEVRPLVRQMRAARRQVSDQLAADDFDPEALARALADLRAKTQVSQSAMHAAMVELAADLTAEERRHLAKAGMHRHGRHRHDYPRPNPPPAPEALN